MSPTQPQGYVAIARRPPDVEDYLDIMRRYKSWILGPLFAGLVISVVAAFLWPDTFISQAVMRITPPQVPEKLVPTNINTQIGERLTQMQQEILSRTSLSELIQRPALDLYRKERQRYPMEDVLDQMRKDVSISVLSLGSAPNQRRGGSAFQIAFAYTDRYKAQAVVRELVTKFTEQNLNVQRTQSSLTTSFLNDELAAAKSNLDKLDKAVMEFKTANQGRLPEQLQSNLQTMSALQQQLASVTETLNRNAQEKMMLETQLQNLRQQADYLQASLEQTQTYTTGESGAAAQPNPRLERLKQSIADGDTQLNALRQVYKENYPDIRTLRARLEVLRKERDELELQEASKNAPSGGPQTATRQVVNPAVARSLQQVKMQISQVQTSIQAKALEMEEKVKSQSNLHNQIQGYQARIEMGPVNEQRYAALMRDYALAKQKYEEMSQRKSLSETATNLEERKGGENLEVLDPASLPEQPAKPNRFLIVGVGTVLGLIVGISLAGFKEVKDTSLKNLKDVRAYTNLPVLSSVPLLENALLVRRKRRLFWLAWSCAVVVGTIAMSGSMYYYYFGKS